MIVFSNCKINLGLQVLGKRNDGYHNLETFFYPLPFFDVLELLPGNRTTLTLFGKNIPGNINDNIILKAYRLLQADHPGLPPVHFYLLKNIPAGAGLGAGSANGTAALQALNQLFHLQIDRERLLRYALDLGSDCPFFVLNIPSLGEGRGEQLSPIAVDLKGYDILVINPGIHINTGAAFGRLHPGGRKQTVRRAIQYPVTEWKNQLVNDFEGFAFDQPPEIATLKEILYKKGAVYASMTGSGSTVFGLFEQNTGPALSDFPDNYFVKNIPL